MLISILKDLFGRTKPSTDTNPAMSMVHGLHELFPESEVRGNSIFFPVWDLTVIPTLIKADGGMAFTSFTLRCPFWDRDIIEQVAAAGQTPREAIGAALFDFYVCMMSGVKYVMHDMAGHIGTCECEGDPIPVQSVFAGQEHKWKAYLGNAMRKGSGPGPSLVALVKQLLPELALRLGNQKISYVKLYAAAAGDTIIGECRIDDVLSPELSAILKNVAQSMRSEEFTSQKMFILFVQEAETYTPYHYTPEKIAQYTRAAMNTIQNRNSSQGLKDYIEDVKQKIGDIHIARELILFIPELLAEQAYPYIQTEESFDVVVDGREETIFKNQHPSYYLIRSALMNESNNNSELLRKTFAAFVSMSAMNNMVTTFRKQSNLAPVEDGGYRISLCYDFAQARVACRAYYTAPDAAE